MLRLLSGVRPALRFGVPLALAALVAVSCSKLGDPVVEPDPEETSPVPTLAPRGDTAIFEGQQLVLVFPATDPKKLGLAYSEAGVGELVGDTWTWRPNSLQAGVYPVRIIVSIDGHAEWADTLDFTVTVIDDPDPGPRLDFVRDTTIREGQALSIALSATNPRNRGLTFSMTGPSDAILTGTVFAWTPGFTRAGVHEVLFRVQEQGAAPRRDSLKVRITVLDVDRPPVLQALRDTTIDTGQTLQFNLSAVDPDGDQVVHFVFSPQGDPPEGAAVNGTTFSWKPRAAQAGAHTLLFYAFANGLSDVDTVVVTVNVPAGPPDPPPVTVPPPVAYWSFDNGTATAAPSEPGGRPISLFGGAPRMDGVFGEGVHFNGTSAQYGEATAAFPDMTEQTLAAWVYVDSLDRTTITLIQESNNASGRDNELSIERPSLSGGWKFMYRTRDDDGRHFSNGSLEAKKWYYLAGVATRDTVRLYINGALDRTFAAGPYNLSGNHYRIQLARKNDGSTIYPFNLRGILDEIKLFNVALTAAQIQSEWNRHKAAAGY
jgi:hypothetical protein